MALTMTNAIFTVCREQLNLAVLSLKESDDLARLTNKWWYDRGECANADKQVTRVLQFY